jgi:hypothetical protein
VLGISAVSRRPLVGLSMAAVGARRPARVAVAVLEPLALALSEGLSLVIYRAPAADRDEPGENQDQTDPKAPSR